MVQSNEEAEMLKFLGIKEIGDLFEDIPKDAIREHLDIPMGISEDELISDAQFISTKNLGVDYINFLGNGIYNRVVPSSVDAIIGRTEFETSYTPYQGEISQGMLQSLFEYQSIISDLTEMDMTNSSMYDGFSALGEAVRMAFRINGRKEILIPANMYTDKVSVINSYSEGLDLKLRRYSVDHRTGFIDLDDLQNKITDNTAAVVCELPNSYGILDENVPKIQEIKKDALIISYYDPISLGSILPPGAYGADIAVAEGQQLGIHPNFGGPLLGLFSFKKEYARKSPGRIIGQTVDSNGKRAFVMTLQTREQHIRRAKATSNICTNQALMALAALSYISVVGSSGLKKIAKLTVANSMRLKNELVKRKLIDQTILKGTPFSDLLVSFNREKAGLQEKLAKEKVLGGLPMSRLIDAVYDSIPNSYFFSVTERTTSTHIDKLLNLLEVL